MRAAFPRGDKRKFNRARACAGTGEHFYATVLEDAGPTGSGTNMNRIALSICVLGVVAAGYSPVVLYANQDGHAPDAQAVAIPSAPAETAEITTGSINPNAVTVAVWSPPPASFAAPLDEAALKEAPLSAHYGIPQAVYSDALPAAYEGDYDAPIWAIVTRGAKLHADPDVSSPTTWFYAVGTKLNVVGYRQGWYQVVDPATARRGFIYAQYYLDALSGPGDAPVVAKAPALTQTALAEPRRQPRRSRSPGPART